MSAFKDKRARVLKCPLCKRKPKRIDARVLVMGGAGIPVVYLARPCVLCARKVEAFGDDPPIAQLCLMLDSMLGKTDLVTALYADAPEAFHAGLGRIIDPLVSNRIRREDNRFFEQHPDCGCRVRWYVPKENLPLFPRRPPEDHERERLLLAIVRVGRDWVARMADSRSEDFGFDETLSLIVPPGDLHERLAPLTQQERDRLLVEDRDLMCAVAAAVWPERLGDLPERYRPPPAPVPGAPKSAHIRKGHWRLTPSGRRVWVKGARIKGGLPVGRHGREPVRSGDWRAWAGPAVRCTDCAHDPGYVKAYCSIAQRNVTRGHWRVCPEHSPAK